MEREWISRRGLRTEQDNLYAEQKRQEISVILCDQSEISLQSVKVM